LIYCNFLQCNNAQNRIWSSLLQRSPKKYSMEIYFIFFWVLFYLLWIFEVYTNFRNIKMKKWFLENIKWMNTVWAEFGPSLRHGSAGHGWIRLKRSRPQRVARNAPWAVTVHDLHTVARPLPAARSTRWEETSGARMSRTRPTCQAWSQGRVVTEITGGVEAPMAVARRYFLDGDRSSVARDVRGWALEHWEREESQTCGQIKGGEDRVVELIEGVAMVVAAAPNLVVAAVLRWPAVYER
jgi:hypothetical protein